MKKRNEQVARSDLSSITDALQEVTNVVRTDSLIVSYPDGKSINALSFSGNEWYAYAVAEDVKTLPLVSGNLAALAVSGKNVREIAVFTTQFQRGKWYSHRLRQPASGECVPVLGPSGVLYRIGNDCYAFSTQHGSWADLHLEGNEEIISSASPSAFLVRQGEMLYVFSFTNAAWSKGTQVSLKKPQPAK